MLEVFKIQTSDFELSIWANNIEDRQKVYFDTLGKRNCFHRFSEVIISSSSELKATPQVLGRPVEIDATTTTKNFSVPIYKPVFFENIEYQVELLFFENEVKDAALCHALKSVNDKFRFSKKRTSMPSRLNGVFGTANNLGWFELPFNYRVGDAWRKLEIQIEVLPTKIDLHKDLPSMYRKIDAEYPLWRFSLAEKTKQNSSQSKKRGYFPLLWLANFNLLREKFEQGLKVIVNSPHNRLQKKVIQKKAEKIKGRVSKKLAEKIKQDVKSHLYNKYYGIDKQYLHIDTPENQFIKMVVKTSKSKLKDFHEKLLTANKKNINHRLSIEFLNNIKQWQVPLKRIESQSFLADVSDFKGNQKESLVLQQKSGYSAVYKVWQELKYYLDAFSNQSTISMKSVADIYEIWCFLTVKKLLIDDLGFELLENKKSKLELSDFLEYQLKDGYKGAFSFKRSDGIKAKLAHEPVFSRKNTEMKSYLVAQQPDILLEIKYPDGRYCLWLFDAKYRIKSKKGRYDSDNIDQIDLVPDDAINQMHRYRDALVRLTKSQTANNPNKSRPVFGAFALYPGYFDQQKDVNPYQEAISEVAIGAFALLPGSDDEVGDNWLKSFLIEQIGLPSSKTFEYKRTLENLYINEAARIPYHGMKQVLYTDLLITASLGNPRNRDPIYFEKFINGAAQYYHMPESTLILKFKKHIIEELKLIALAVPSEEFEGTIIELIWPVNSVTLLPRKEITKEQSGKESTSEEKYYLFKLGLPLKLKKPISGVPTDSFRSSMILSTLSNMEDVNRFEDIESVYDRAI